MPGVDKSAFMSGRNFGDAGAGIVARSLADIDPLPKQGLLKGDVRVVEGIVTGVPLAPRIVSVPRKPSIPVNASTPINASISANVSIPINTSIPVNVSIPVNATIPVNAIAPEIQARQSAEANEEETKSSMARVPWWLWIVFGMFLCVLMAFCVLPGQDFVFPHKGRSRRSKSKDKGKPIEPAPDLEQDAAPLLVPEYSSASSALPAGGNLLPAPPILPFALPAGVAPITAPMYQVAPIAAPRYVNVVSAPTYP